MCPGSSGPFYIVTSWVTTSWTHSTVNIYLPTDLSVSVNSGGPTASTNTVHAAVAGTWYIKQISWLPQLIMFDKCSIYLRFLKEAAKKLFFSGLATKRGGVKALPLRKKNCFWSSKQKNVATKLGGKALVDGPLKNNFFRLPLYVY